MKKVVFLVSLLLAAFVTVPAFAQPTLNWNYLSGQYAHQTKGFPQNGLNVDGSVNFAGNFLLQGSSTEWLNGATHVNETTVGLGGYVPLVVPGLYGYGTVQLLANTAAVNSRTNTTWGTGVEVGLRYALTSNFNVWGAVQQQHLNQATLTNRNETYGVVGAELDLTTNLGIVGEVRGSGQNKEAYAGVRLNF